MVLFDNDLDSYEEEAIDNLVSSYREQLLYDSNCRSDLDNEEVDLREIEWDNTRIELKNYFDNHKCLAWGTIERWDGKTHGWQFVDSFNDVMDMICGDIDYIELIDGQLQIVDRHHDGTNDYAFKPINENKLMMLGEIAEDNHPTLEEMLKTTYEFNLEEEC